jgi:hypothetical protein
MKVRRPIGWEFMRIAGQLWPKALPPAPSAAMFKSGQIITRLAEGFTREVEVDDTEKAPAPASPPKKRGSGGRKRIRDTIKSAAVVAIADNEIDKTKPVTKAYPAVRARLVKQGEHLAAKASPRTMHAAIADLFQQETRH